MKRVFDLVFCAVALGVVTLGGMAARAATPASELTPQEKVREAEFRKRLCARKDLDCDYVQSLFDDPRLTIYEPPAPTPVTPPAPASPARQRNPYLTPSFGLFTPESLERCRSFISAHILAFDAAQQIYGVPREVICGHLRIETDFGLATILSPHPLGTFPAVDRLVSLYVRRPLVAQRSYSFAHRQDFALAQLVDLLSAAKHNDWDLFDIPGSSTGAIGLVQFEPSVFDVAVDGDGDGKIDLFDPDDAILSVAHYLVTRGWDQNPEHQKRAVYAYYGGHYDSDPYKYYMKAVLAYADEVRGYLNDHPVEPALTFLDLPPAMPDPGLGDAPPATDTRPPAN